MGIAVWLVPSEPESALLQQLMSRHPTPGAPPSFPHFHPHITLASIAIPPPIASGDCSDEAKATPAKSTRNSDSNSNSNSNSNAGSDPAADPDPDPDPRVLLALREAIPLGQRAVHVRFARVLSGDHYFRSIYVSIAPSPELARLRAALALAPQGGHGHGRGGGGPDSPPAFPHLSLYYIADEEAHTRARYFQELEREDVVRHSADGLSVALRCAAAAAGEGEGEGEGDGGHGREGVLKSCTCTQIWIVDCEGPVEGWKVLDKILLAK